MNDAVRILVVERSGTQALKLSLVCEQQGWKVAVASSGEEAVVEFDRATPNLILAGDFPGQFAAHEFGQDVPILVLADEDERPGAPAGEWISSSAVPEVLVSRIRGLLSGKLAVAAACAPGNGFRGSLVLAVDDSPTYLSYVSESLRLEGYNVETAKGGEQGLQQLDRRNFDCVLVDLIMPGMDGIEMCRRIRAQVNPVATIILTSRENAGDMARGLEAGADDFVGKSSDLAVLKARLRALLRRNFFEQAHRRALEELKAKELETLRARSEKEASDVRAAAAEKLEQANYELEELNRKLRETQTQLVQTEKMASLGQLVAGIAHEINNPLAFALNHSYTIQGALDAIGSEVDAHCSEAVAGKVRKTRIRVDEMRVGLMRVRDLVTNLRTFSRLDEGDLKTVDLHENMDSALMFLRHKMDGRIELVKRYGEIPQVSCLAGQMNQVIMNLLANAIDAIEGRGTITLSTWQENASVFISVRDTGSGIPEPIRSRIFDPFFTTKPVGQGTGLGLAISYQIIQAHRGAIEVRSEVGQGTEFLLRIPHECAGAIQ